jgi:hypothetical protein
VLKLDNNRKTLYQWDVGVIGTLAIDGVDEVHFSNLRYGVSFNIKVVDNKVEFPPEVLQSGADVFCWAFVREENGGYTKKEQIFNVEKRPRPADYVYEPTEVLNWETLKKEIEKLDENTDKALADLEKGKEDIEQSVKDLEKSLSKYQLKTQKLVAINPKDAIKIWELETGVYRFSGNIYTRVENGEPTGALNYNENSVLIVNKRYAGGNQIYNWFILGEFVNHYTTGYVPINTGFFYVTKNGNIVSKEWKIQGDAIVQDIASNANNSSTYPSTKAVYDYVQSVIPPTAEEVEY